MGVIALPLQGGWVTGGTRYPGRRGVPLALGYYVSALQAENLQKPT